MTPSAVTGHTSLRLQLPDHLVREAAKQRGLPVGQWTGETPAHINLLYGLPGCLHLQDSQRERIADLLREARVLAVDVVSPIVFCASGTCTVGLLLYAPHLEDLRDDLLREFPEARDPYRAGGWVPHITLAHLGPGESWQFLAPRRWYPVALPVAAFELHRADGVVEVLTPMGDLTAYR